MLQQKAAERDAAEEMRRKEAEAAGGKVESAKLQRVRALLRRQDSFLKPMIEGDLLTAAFREFDLEGKGEAGSGDAEMEREREREAREMAATPCAGSS